MKESQMRPGSTAAIAAALLLMPICTIPLFKPCATFAQPTTAEAARSSSDASIVADLRSTLATLSAQDKFSGAALLGRHGSVLFQAAYGYADHSFGVKNTVHTKFNIASMGKMFTGVAVLQLVQAGKLSLDEQLIKALPTYPNRSVAQSVTIRQLLNHTSGLGDFFGPQFAAANMSNLDSLESLLPFFVDKPLLFNPGSRWQYSNAGYIVLGLVVAHVSGETYYDYVRHHIFEPAGMHDTGNWPADEDVPNRAVGYTTADPHRARKSNIFSLQRGGSAGGGYSTVGDLFRFATALLNNRLLNAAYTKLDLRGQVATDRPGVRYGFGMEEKVMNGVRVVGHSGGGPGIQGILDMYPERGFVVAMLSNYDDGVAAIDQHLRIALTGGRAAQAVAVSSNAIAAVLGKYAPVIPAGMAMTPPPISVTADASGITVDPGMGPPFHFVPLSATEFAGADDPSLHITFIKDGAGRVTSLKTTGFGPVPPITAKRLP